MIKYTILPIVTLAIIAVVLASVFAYYPLTITATPQAPGVVFQQGSNAGQPDIGTDNHITVTLGANSTSASVRIHPTYQDNYYKDVLRIYNGDDNAMNVSIVFTSRDINLPPDSNVTILVYKDGTMVWSKDITNPPLNTVMRIGKIASRETWQIDFYVYIPEGKSIRNAKYEVKARLVYTPSGETPPVNPASGR